MFKNAHPHGFVSLRAFRDDEDGHPAIFVEPIHLSSPDLDALVVERARQTANWSKPAVFCPPIATFKTPANAKTENLREGVALSVECDQSATEARRRLTGILPLRDDALMTQLAGGLEDVGAVPLDVLAELDAVANLRHQLLQPRFVRFGGLPTVAAFKPN